MGGDSPEGGDGGEPSDRPIALDIGGDAAGGMDLDRQRLVLGFVIGVFGGCVGLVLVVLLSKHRRMRDGATLGFVAQIVTMGVVWRLLAPR